MSDYIQIPQPALELVKDSNAWQLYGYLLSKADNDNIVITSLRDLADKTGQSLRNIRTALSRLVATQCVTQRPTQHATYITLCNIAHNIRDATQRPTHRLTQQPTRTKKDQFDFARFMNYFNQGFAGTAIPKITKMTDRRKTALNNIIKEHGKEAVISVLRKAYASDFLSGRKTEWHASFDWIFNKTNFQKILEDNYVNGVDSAQRQQSAGRGQHRNPTIDDLAREIYGDAAY